MSVIWTQPYNICFTTTNQNVRNFLVSGLTEIIGEAHVFAEKSEMGCDVVEKLLEAQFGALPTMISKRLTEGVYMPPKGEVATQIHTRIVLTS